MTKVFHLYKTFYPYSHGGVEKYIDSIMNSNSHFDHYLISIGDENLSNAKKIIFKKTFSYSSDIFSLDLINFILKNIDKEKDIIHLHSPWPTMELFFCFFNYKKIIITYHSDIIRQKFVNFFYKFANIYFLKNKVKKIIVTSKIYSSTSKILNKIPDDLIQVLPIGIADIKNFNDLDLIEDCRSNYVIFIGSNRTYKGIPLLKKIIDTENKKFILIGSNLLDFKKYNNVQVYENIDEEKKIELISKSSFLLMTSTSRNEAFGIVLIEALRSGIPLITPNINSGVIWINKNNFTGYVYQVGDLNDLKSKFKKINDLETKKYLQFRVNSRKRYIQHFQLSTMIKDLDKLYSKIS